MPKLFILFDMDGVLLEPNGYKQALQTSVKRIGSALGAPNAQITVNQIARFETAHITNEWDTIAICAALILVHVWIHDPTIRLNDVFVQHVPVTHEIPDFDHFLMVMKDGGPLPGKTAFQKICDLFPWLSVNQRTHLKIILENCRDIYSSPTLPAHQETILGSKVFQSHYGLLPQFDSESYLLKYDRPIITPNQRAELIDWLSYPDHFAGIMTNRPNKTQNGHLSPPEAELGVNAVELDFLPIVGSGILAWYAEKFLNMPDYSLVKPNPIHALTVILCCLGRSPIDALQISVALWQEKGQRSDWNDLDGSQLVIFEDSTKGLISAQESSKLLAKLGIHINLKLVGVSTNAIKLNALKKITTHYIENINDIQWTTLFME